GGTGVPGEVAVVLLVADGEDWTVHGEARVATGLPTPGPARLVGLDGSFAVVTTDEALGRSSISLIDPADLSRPGPSVIIPTSGPVGLGAVDVDRDGRRELVVTGDAAVEPVACPGTVITVLDPRSLAVRATSVMEGVGLDGAAVGRFGPAGAERIVAYSTPGCLTVQYGSLLGSVVVDPASGDHRQIAVSPIGLLGQGPGPFVPLVADLDEDGIDEVIMRQGSATVVVDPAHDWRVESMLQTDSVPLGVVDSRDHPRLVIQRTDDTGTTRIDVLAIGRIRPGAELSSRGLVGSIVDPGAVSGLGQAAGPTTSLPVLVEDLETTGCLTVLVPSTVIRRCPGTDESWTAAPGPPWLQTVPLAAYGEPGHRDVLVAAGTEWAQPGQGLAVPSPEASGAIQASRWRSRPSAPFALQVVDVARLAGTSGVDATGGVGIDSAARTGPVAAVELTAHAGDRLFVRMVTAPAEAGAPDPAPIAPEPTIDPVEFLLSSAPAAGPQAVPLAAGSARADQVSTEVPLTPGAVAWVVDAMSLDSLGRPSAVSHGRVELDTTGPTLSVATPFLTAPWPLPARIAGTAEPGARVRLGTGPFVGVAADGSFAVGPQLAPWPQDLEFEAIDRAGNPSWLTISVVGGIDYRQLPFQGLVVALVLVAAAATTWTGPMIRRRRGPAVGDRSPDPADRGLPSTRGPVAPGGQTRIALDPSGDPSASGEIEDLPPNRNRRGT
ncbi:MAG TPA: hypothetical protein VLR93_06510, partial [Patescibacteria group bacterium]|nr:hypothetical protein [Patescibacteria group bacterium]